MKSKELTVINKDVFEVRHGVELTPVGMKFPEALKEDQWNDIGDQVIRLENASNWIIGDWWAFGQHQYGNRKKWLAEQIAKRAQVKSFQTLRHMAVVCRSYQTCRRRHTVSFEMHRELLGLDEVKQDKFLDLIEAGEIKTHKELRAKLAPAKTKRTKAKPLVIRMFLGTCHINNPLPSWHVVDDQNQENNQTITCTKCWSYSTGGETEFPSNERRWTYACRCPESTRTGPITEYKK